MSHCPPNKLVVIHQSWEKSRKNCNHSKYLLTRIFRWNSVLGYKRMIPHRHLFNYITIFARYTLCRIKFPSHTVHGVIMGASHLHSSTPPSLLVITRVCTLPYAFLWVHFCCCLWVSCVHVSLVVGMCCYTLVRVIIFWPSLVGSKWLVFTFVLLVCTLLELFTLGKARLWQHRTRQRPSNTAKGYMAAS